jgi:antitoxin CcdA
VRPALQCALQCAHSLEDTDWTMPMNSLFDSGAPKKATNLSVNSDLLIKCRELDINLSATLEQALQQKLAAARAENWAVENKNAIRAYNDLVDEQGCFGEEYRTF